MGVSQIIWLIMENPICQWNWGYPYFRKLPAMATEEGARIADVRSEMISLSQSWRQGNLQAGPIQGPKRRQEEQTSPQ